MELPQQRERVTVDGLGNIGGGKYNGGSGKESPVKVPPVGSKVTNKVTAAERRELEEKLKPVRFSPEEAAAKEREVLEQRAERLTNTYKYDIM